MKETKTCVGFAVKKLNKDTELFRTKPSRGMVLIGMPFENNLPVIEEMKEAIVALGIVNQDDILGSYTFIR